MFEDDVRCLKNFLIVIKKVIIFLEGIYWVIFEFFKFGYIGKFYYFYDFLCLVYFLLMFY